MVAPATTAPLASVTIPETPAATLAFACPLKPKAIATRIRARIDRFSAIALQASPLNTPLPTPTAELFPRLLRRPDCIVPPGDCGPCVSLKLLKFRDSSKRLYAAYISIIRQPSQG